mmetsp:Transcript_25197/g.55843  ORF Transcript_25197/g.55843 Transcript_25197/m.55843 type:complete len:821 (-) Transcript_25197:114-2576(-)
MMPIASCLLVVVALCSLLCVQGAVHLTNSMPTQARSGSSFKLLKTRVHQKMQNKMKRRLEEGEHEGVISTSAEEEVTYLPTLLLAASVGEPISFGLLDGEEVKGEIGAVTAHGTNRFVWSGTIEGGGSFYLSYSAGAIMGNVYYPSRGLQYEYRPLNRVEGSYSLRAVPTNVYDEEPEEVHAQEMLHSAKRTIPGHLRGDAKLAKKAQGVATLDTATDNAILDVMVLFTNEAYDYFNNDVDSVQAFADLGVQMSNDAYANSGIALRMRLVRAAKVSSNTLQESSFEGDLDRLTNTNDGFMDEDADRIRKAVGADAVVLVTADAQYCGLAWLTADTSLAYGLISVYCPDALSHEVGHNIGAHHDRVTTGITNMNKYNFGYCWDTSATTCSRSVMAYAGCVTANNQSNCPRAFFFSSPSIRDGDYSQTTGVSTSDNARTHNDHVGDCTNWRESDTSAGMLFSVSPSAATIGRCQAITIEGWQIGSGNDITSVTLNGVAVAKILSQNKNSVSVELSETYTAGTGDVVVTAGGVVTTLSGGFSFLPEAGTFTTAFESSLPTYWAAGGDCYWRYIRFCSSTPCTYDHTSAPAVGYGGTGDFALAESAADEPSDAKFATFFNSEGCADTVTSISLYYHMYTQASVCRGSLEIQQVTKTNSNWNTVAQASIFQVSQSSPWLPLTHTFSQPDEVTGIRIVADPHSDRDGCYEWATVSIDDVQIVKSSDCSAYNCTYNPEDFFIIDDDDDNGGNESSSSGGGTNTRGMIIIGAIVLGAIIAAVALLSACFCGSSASPASANTAPRASAPPLPPAQVPVAVAYMEVEQHM